MDAGLGISSLAELADSMDAGLGISSLAELADSMDAGLGISSFALFALLKRATGVIRSCRSYLKSNYCRAK